MPTWSQLAVDLVLFLIPTALTVRGLVRMRRAVAAAEAIDMAALPAASGPVAAAFTRLTEARRRGATASNAALEKVGRGLALPYADGVLLAFAVVAGAAVLLAQPYRAVGSTLVAVEAPTLAGIAVLRLNAGVAAARIAAALRAAIDADERPRAGS